MKKGYVSKNDAIGTFDNTMVCGIVGSPSDTVNSTQPPPTPSLPGSFPGCNFRYGKAFGQESDDYSDYDYISIWLNTPEMTTQNTDFNPYYQGTMLRKCLAAKKTPLFYAYIIAFEGRVKQGLKDCDVGTPSLCQGGADFIRGNREYLVSRYEHQASKIAEIIGTDGEAVFLIEPDFWQYYGDREQWNGVLSGEYMRALFDDFARAIKKHLPKAKISWDISAWIGEQGMRTWWSFFKSSPFVDFVHTSGGQARGELANIKPGELSWSVVNKITERKIIADCGYGVGGADSDNCWPWHSEGNVRDRTYEGVVAVTEGFTRYKDGFHRLNLC